MPKKTKDSVPVSMRLDRNVYMRFRNYADEKGQSYTLCLERIINGYLDEIEEHEQELLKHNSIFKLRGR